MIETIEFKGELYPKFQSTGNASRFCMPFALEICKGVGVDIGCNREEWKFPGATCIDISLCDCDAMNLPFRDEELDYCYSSHCLEHLSLWVDALEHWTKKLKSGGVLFLYLPDYSQVYWRVENNRKHIHTFTPEIIRNYLCGCRSFTNIFVSGVDANNSFTAFCEKI